MLYRYGFSLVALWALLGMSSCIIDLDDDDGLFGSCVRGRGAFVLESLVIPADFEAIELRLSATVFVTQSDEFLIEVEGHPNIIDELELEVNDGELRIDTDDCVRDIGDMRFFIRMPNIRGLEIDGSGSIISENVLLVNDVQLDIFGSGNLDVALDADDIDARIDGSGDLFLEGVADELDLDIDGSGDLRAFDLPVREADIDISGSGEAEITVSDFLRARISGSGDIRYRGNPNVDTSISGSGSIRKVD